jgi:hypothetical protein
MKKTIKISLSDKEIEYLKSVYKEKGFNSIDEYIQCLIELDNFDDELISKEELLKEYERGECKTANSLAELL